MPTLALNPTATNLTRCQAFLAIQIILTGIPLLLFVAFAITTLLVSLTTCILLGILTALAFTFIVVGLALIFVVPTVFLASCSATFIFVWSFAGYLILRRFNDGEAPGKPGTRVGDKLQGLTGGRLGLWIGDAAGEERDEGFVEVGKAAGPEGQVGGHAVEDRGGASREGGRRVVNGVNGVHDWEEKWSNGSRKETHDLETDNVYENLKVVSPMLPECGVLLTFATGRNDSLNPTNDHFLAVVLY